MTSYREEQDVITGHRDENNRPIKICLMTTNFNSKL